MAYRSTRKSRERWQRSGARAASAPRTNRSEFPGDSLRSSRGKKTTGRKRRRARIRGAAHRSLRHVLLPRIQDSIAPSRLRRRVSSDPPTIQPVVPHSSCSGCSSGRVTSEDQVGRFGLLVAGKAGLQESRVGGFAVLEVTEPPAAGCCVLG
jgi:hypothetical protein